MSYLYGLGKSKRGIVMPNQITHAQSSNIHLLVHILISCGLISCSYARFTVVPNHVIASHPPPGAHDMPPEERREVRKTHEPSKNSRGALDQLYMHEVSPLLPIFRILNSIPSLSIKFYYYFKFKLKKCFNLGSQ